MWCSQANSLEMRCWQLLNWKAKKKILCFLLIHFNCVESCFIIFYVAHSIKRILPFSIAHWFYAMRTCIKSFIESNILYFFFHLFFTNKINNGQLQTFYIFVLYKQKLIDVGAKTQKKNESKNWFEILVLFEFSTWPMSISSTHTIYIKAIIAFTCYR